MQYLRSASRISSGQRWERAFTLVELLAVTGIVVMLLAVVVSPLAALRSAGDINAAAVGIPALLVQARTYAMAHNTYVWIGFAERNGQDLAVGIVAGKTGQSSDLSPDPGLPMNYAPVGKPSLFSGVALGNINGLSALIGMATNTDASPDNAVDLSATPAPGGFKENVAGSSTTFTTIMQWSPQGEVALPAAAHKTHWIQIGLQPRRGGVASVTNPVVFQVANLTGEVLVFRP